MRLVKYTHACVRLEGDGGVLVIDPGAFSERDALAGADAVLVTHEHLDHLDVDAVVDEHTRRPELKIFVHEQVAPKLAAIAESVTTVAVGDEFEVAGFKVRAHGGTHAEIHSDIPRIANLGFVIDERVYHPGDALHVPDATTVDTLLVPVSGPWLRAADAIDFVRAVAPRRAVAIHEALYTPVALGIVDNLFGNLSRTEFSRLPSGQAMTLD